MTERNGSREYCQAEKVRDPFQHQRQRELSFLETVGHQDFLYWQSVHHKYHSPRIWLSSGKYISLQLGVDKDGDITKVSS